MTDLLRRSPAVILAAHVLDPKRIELFVEGAHDRLFIDWLTEPTRNANSLVREIATVDLPDAVLGGERTRLVSLALLVEDSPARIRFFADADLDRVFENAVPGNVWLTDHRDIEGYFLRLECIDKVLRVGARTGLVTADDLLADILSIGRRVGLLRCLSARDGLDLPFQRTGLWRRLKASRGRVTYDEHSFVRALIQNAETPLGELPALLGELATIEEEYATVRDLEIIHGKDAAEILAKALSCFGVCKADASRLLWASFERAFVEDAPTLARVETYLADRANG